MKIKTRALGAAATAVAAGALMLSATSASAVDAVTVNGSATAQLTFDAAGNASVDVAWTDSTNTFPAFITECFKNPLDPTFNYGADCLGISEVSNLASDGPSYLGFGVTKVAGKADETHPAWIRVTTGSPTNNAVAKGAVISFTTVGNPVPEAPYAAILPVGAVVVLAGGFLVLRNRKAAAA